MAKKIKGAPRAAENKAVSVRTIYVRGDDEVDESKLEPGTIIKRLKA